MREGEIRDAVHSRLRDLHRSEERTLYRDELGLCLGETRVDVAAINGTISGYEIKSARDTLARLPSQIELYGRVLDHACLVVDVKFAGRVDHLLPDWWALWIVNDSGDGAVVNEVRAGSVNANHDPLSVAQLLWRDEALGILTELGLASGLRSATRWQLWDALTHLPLEQLRKLVREQLKSRDRWPGG